MMRDRFAVLPVLFCLLLSACATRLEPRSTYTPPPGAAPMEMKTVDSDELRFERGSRGEKLGAEVVNSETEGDLQSIELRIPLPPKEVDQVEVMSPSGEPVRMTREAQIIHNYETNDVGIKFQIPKSENMGFRLKLIDHPDNDWPPMRQQ